MRKGTDPIIENTRELLREMESVKNTTRKSPRANFHDYSGGDYFITICTFDKKHYFGEIADSVMYLSQIGEYTRQQIELISDHYPYAKTIISVVMPNHIHAIVQIKGSDTDSHDCQQADGESNFTSRRTHEPCVPTTRTALSVIVGGIKRSVTMYARRNNIDFGWQSRYHDHIIRNHIDYSNIYRYIETNIAQWDSDLYKCHK